MSVSFNRFQGHHGVAVVTKPIGPLMEQGLALHRSNDLAGARSRFGQVLAIDPQHAEALHALGVISAQGGEPDAALGYFDRAIASDSGHAMAHFNRGIALMELQRVDEAISSYQRALEIRPDFDKARTNLRVAMKRAGRSDDKAGALAVAANWSASACQKHGVKLLDADKHEQALAFFDLALAKSPDMAEAHCCRGIALKVLGQPALAIAAYTRAIELKPDLAQAHYNLGMVLQAEGRHRESLAAYDRAIAVYPAYTKAHSNRGNLLLEIGRYDEALAGYDRALEFDPRFAVAWSNRGVVLQAMNRLQEALASYDRAVELDPDYAENRWNRAVCLLLGGDFSRGWPEYEWRWRNPKLRLYGGKHPLHEPRLTADADLHGKTVLLYAEQGLGDTLQFCRYVPLLAARGARVLLQAQAALLPLLRDLEGVAEVFSNNDQLPAFDLQCPLLSLPAVFGTDLDTVPSPGRYIHPSPAKLQAWRQRLGPARGRRIGLVWSGSPKHSGDRKRSITLADLLPLLELDAEFFSLQKELRPADQKTLDGTAAIRHFGDELHDFGDTAALCELMDHVVSVDTSVAHLAGALDKPVSILLPFAPDWRWMLDRGDTPWYPRTRLYRQPLAGDWAAVIKTLRGDLQRT